MMYDDYCNHPTDQTVTYPDGSVYCLVCGGFTGDDDLDWLDDDDLFWDLDEDDDDDE